MVTNPEANSLDDFFNRFDALLQEAKGHGLEAVILLMENNPISNHTIMRSTRHGNFYACIGALEALKAKLLLEEQ